MNENQKCQSPRAVQIDVNSPEWAAGLVDGSAPGALAAPDMRRGIAYAMGYLTAKIQQQPPSLRRH